MMKKLFLALILVVPLLLTGCGVVSTGTISSGDVGVVTSFGKVSPEEKSEGFYLTFLSHVDEYTARETSVTLTNMTPKAKDKLILKDLDVAVYYRPAGSKVAEFVVSHASMSARLEDEPFYRVGYYLIDNLARGVVQDEVSKFDSLTLHQNRSDLEVGVKMALQAELDKSDPGMFVVTRVVVTSLLTDPSVEDSIRKNIQMNNEIDTAKKEIDKKRQEAEAMMKTANALTPMLLQHEYIKAVEKCAERQGCTLIIGMDKASPMLNVPK